MILQRQTGSLYYEIHGDGNNESIVYLNGFASGISNWYPVIKGLKACYRNVVYDYGGTGDSESCGGYVFCFDTYCDDLNGLLDEIGTESAHLVGYSMGGWIGQEFACRNSRRVKSLVLVNSSSRIFARQRWIISHFIDVLRDSDISVFSKLMFISYYSPEYFERHDANLDRIKNLANSYFGKQSRSNWESLLHSCLSFDAESRLGHLRMPVLIVSGENDFLCPRMTARRFKELIPASHWLELASVGHAVPMECHSDLSLAIRELLAGKFSAEAAGNLGLRC